MKKILFTVLALTSLSSFAQNIDASYLKYDSIKCTGTERVLGVSPKSVIKVNLKDMTMTPKKYSRNDGNGATYYFHEQGRVEPVEIVEISNGIIETSYGQTCSWRNLENDNTRCEAGYSYTLIPTSEIKNKKFEALFMAKSMVAGVTTRIYVDCKLK